MSIEINQSVIMLGPKTLQNSVLSGFISDSGAFSCQILNSLSEVRVNWPNNEILVLVDVSVSTSYLDLLNPLSDTVRVALISVEENDEEENSEDNTHR